MEMVERVAAEIDIGNYIFEAVTKEKTYGYFEAKGIPCSKDTFYDRLRRFYFLLDKVRR